MNRFFASLFFVVILTSCSNTTELETGEIRTLQLLQKSFDNSNKPKPFINARNLINRKQIDAANIPIIFVELESGQNGTLTLYPGQGIGQTYLGADGATVTLEKGILKASRGMGDDLMGSSTSMPPLSEINKNKVIYSRELSHITGNNTISKRVFVCDIQKTNGEELIKIWGIDFKVTKFEESCFDGTVKFKNIYYFFLYL